MQSKNKLGERFAF